MIETVKRHKRLIDLMFAFLYFAGIIFLIYYSIQINDVVFFYLNTSIFVFVAGELLVSMFLIKKRKK